MKKQRGTAERQPLLHTDLLVTKRSQRQLGSPTLEPPKGIGDSVIHTTKCFWPDVTGVGCVPTQI